MFLKDDFNLNVLECVCMCACLCVFAFMHMGRRMRVCVCVPAFVPPLKKTTSFPGAIVKKY